jgi:hypothetical protein
MIARLRHRDDRLGLVLLCISDPRHAIAPKFDTYLADLPDKRNFVVCAQERLVAAAEHLQCAVGALELQLGLLALVDILKRTLDPDDRARLIPIRNPDHPNPGALALGVLKLDFEVIRRALSGTRRVCPSDRFARLRHIGIDGFVKIGGRP